MKFIHENYDYIPSQRVGSQVEEGLSSVEIEDQSPISHRASRPRRTRSRRHLYLVGLACSPRRVLTLAHASCSLTIPRRLLAIIYRRWRPTLSIRSLHCSFLRWPHPLFRATLRRFKVEASLQADVLVEIVIATGSLACARAGSMWKSTAISVRTHTLQNPLILTPFILLHREATARSGSVRRRRHTFDLGCHFSCYFKGGGHFDDVASVVIKLAESSAGTVSTV